jgi:hypothetical protein
MPKNATLNSLVTEGKPWLARADWASGKIKSSTDADPKSYFVMAFAFCGVGGVIAAMALWHELPKGNYQALVTLLFPVFGAFLMVYCVRQERRYKHFGQSIFVMSPVPGTPGGALAGMVETGNLFRPEQGVHVRLSCVGRLVHAKDLSGQEFIKWQDEKILKNEAIIVAADHRQFPVFFEIPAEEPGCSASSNETIVWRLEATAKTSGPDFKALFDVPIFNVAHTMVDADPTLGLQMPVEEARRQEHSKIQLCNSPNGREFIFPAARNPGTACKLTAGALIFAGFAWFATGMQAPFFTIAFGLLATGLGIVCVNFWLKQSTLTINPHQTVTVNRWLLLRRTGSSDTMDIRSFQIKGGMQSGQRVFYSIQMIARSGKKTTVGGGIASKPEAEWLAQEMNRALGRPM